MAGKRVVKLNGSRTNGSHANGSEVNRARRHLEKEDHPTGLWVDADAFARIRSGSRETIKKETFSATQHYLDLAALVLDGKKERKRKSRGKSANGSAAE